MATIVNADQFVVCEGGRFLCGLNEGQVIHIFGIADLLVHKGAVNVLGAIRRVQDKTIRLFSPRSTSFLGIFASNEQVTLNTLARSHNIHVLLNLRHALSIHSLD